MSKVIKKNIDFESVKDRVLYDKTEYKDSNCISKKILLNETDSETFFIKRRLIMKHSIPKILKNFLGENIECCVFDVVKFSTKAGISHSKIHIQKIDIIIDLIIRYSKNISLDVKILKHNNVSKLTQSLIIKCFTNKTIKYINSHYLEVL